MKNIKFILIASLLAFSLQIQGKIPILNNTLKVNSYDQKKDKYTIKGNVQGFQNGTKVYINKQEANRFIIIDSTEVVDSKFKFSGTTDQIELCFIEFDNTKEYIIPFILEKGEINIIFDKLKPEEFNIIGTKNNEYLISHNNEIISFDKKLQNFQKQNNDLMTKAKKNQDTETIENLMTEYNKINQEMYDFKVDFVKSNNDSYVSLLILNQISHKISDEEFLAFYNSIVPELKTTTIGKNLAKKITLIDKITIGKIAPDFSAPNINNQMVSLKESLGRVTIIDFWSAFCEMCKNEKTTLKAIYDKYKNQGLSIVSISLDKESEIWKKAINEYQLDWTHISNFKFWDDPIVNKYNVKSIPYFIVLDASGKIVAKNSKSAELESKIVELLY